MNTYPSKILLFGEYTILSGSLALAVPFRQFEGRWCFPGDNCPAHGKISGSDNILHSLYEYLSGLEKKNPGYTGLDMGSFKKDLANGLFFNSSIPSGMGLGSSGALSAAVFGRYGSMGKRENEIQTDELKKKLIIIEDFFHGNSSGIDPLVSYLDMPVLINDMQEQTMNNSDFFNILTDYGLFLADSGKSRNTKMSVRDFYYRLKNDDEYTDMIRNEYIPVNNRCITQLCTKERYSVFSASLSDLIRLQLRIFRLMIPDKMAGAINYGLDTGMFGMKLCGAGGGGYFLGFTGNLSETRQYFTESGFGFLSLDK